MHVFVDDFAYVHVGACEHMHPYALFMPQCTMYAWVCVYVCASICVRALASAPKKSYSQGSSQTNKRRNKPTAEVVSQEG